MSKGVELLKEKLKADGKRPMGYINAAKELQQQLKGQGLTIDYIFFASSSGGTLAGLTLGKSCSDYLLNSCLSTLIRLKCMALV